MGCIGRAIASGRGFSDPFCVPSGPSAWEPPTYPYLIGGVFRALGIYSTASAWMLLSLNSLFSALTCIPVYLIARRMMGEKVAQLSAWTWALLPYVWYWSIHWVWDTTLSPLLLSLIVLVALQLEEWEGMKGWALFGVLWGMAALTNPSLLSFLPFSGLWAWHRRRKRGFGSLTGVAVGSLLFLLCLSPWLIRNYRVFGQFVFIRDDFGQQLRLGNGPGANGVSMVYLQPNLNTGELQRFRNLGELAYDEEREREAFAFIRQNPGRFLVISLKRFVYYWAGIPRADSTVASGVLRRMPFLASSILALWGLVRAMRRKMPGAWLLALLVLSYPSVYYLVYPHARYRHPIEPELIVTAVFLLVAEAKVPKDGKAPIAA
jgi:4-amino-4-deoxy-L-arabinose transferase-like glycosyltransferase